MNSYYNRNRLPQPWEQTYGQQGAYPQQPMFYPQQQIGMGSGLLGGFGGYAKRDKHATFASDAYTNYVNSLLQKNAPQYAPQPQTQGLFGFSQQPKRQSFFDRINDYGGGGNNGDGS
ncbi:hypothetical protein HMPREF3144_06450 [Oligella sp. HMSC05A10]|uniref:hypothetical protein n=1 Tax=Oligella sp. HMSC05A10 TaxID=1581112 RepID=UPI0008A262F7|nr:hypothetical protein [Oligella sp. HMSC05A10]OFS84481.1 hypothetical protein HMPREF3144_06450 [Oligella sp. HMSC05A10]